MDIKQVLEAILEREGMHGYIIDRKIQNQDVLARGLFKLIAEAIKPTKHQVAKLKALEGLILASKMVNKSQFDQLIRKHGLADEGEKGKKPQIKIDIEGLFE